jgi:hypothetical protein
MMGFDPVAFSVARDTDTSGSANPLPFNIDIQNDKQYFNKATNKFMAPSSGTYYFSFSVGVMAGRGVDLILYKNNQAFVNIYRTSTSHNGVDTMSRSILMSLTRGDFVYLVNNNKPIRSSSSLETSFSGFKYQPKLDTGVMLLLYYICVFKKQTN